MVNNRDQRPGDYQEMSNVLGHLMQILPISTSMVTGHRGGDQVHETIGRVAAGAIAEKWLREQYGTNIISW